MFAILVLCIVYIASFLLCILLAKLNKRSSSYDDALQYTIKTIALLPVFNTFLAFIGIMRVIIYLTFNSKRIRFIKYFYNRLFD